MSYTEDHLCMHNTSNLEADELQRWVPRLSGKNRILRLQFEKADQIWTTKNWKHFAWSDEPQVLLPHLDCKVKN